MLKMHFRVCRRKTRSENFLGVENHDKCPLTPHNYNKFQVHRIFFVLIERKTNYYDPFHGLPINPFPETNWHIQAVVQAGFLCTPMLTPGAPRKQIWLTSIRPFFPNLFGR